MDSDASCFNSSPKWEEVDAACRTSRSNSLSYSNKYRRLWFYHSLFFVFGDLFGDLFAKRM